MPPKVRQLHHLLSGNETIATGTTPPPGQSHISSSSDRNDDKEKAVNPPPPLISGVIDLLKAAQASGKMASTSAIAIIPKHVSADDVKQLNDIQLLQTFAIVNGFTTLSNEYPKGFNPSSGDSVAEFTQKASNAILSALTHGMSSFLTLVANTNHALEKNVTSKTLHKELLHDVFKPFELEDDQLSTADKLLTDLFTSMKKNLTGKTEETVVDHLLIVYYFDDIQGLPGAKVVKLRVVSIHIDDSTWKSTILSKFDEKEFSFSMSYEDKRFEMNRMLVEQHEQDIKNIIEKMAGISFDSVSALCSPEVVEADV